MSDVEAHSRSILRPHVLPRVEPTGISADVRMALAFALAAPAIRGVLSFVPVLHPPTTGALVASHTGNPLSDFSFYLWSMGAGVIFQITFYLFTKRYLDLIHVPYFARSDGERYQWWLIIHMLATSLTLTIDPSFWYLGPVMALVVSTPIVVWRHLYLNRLITEALEKSGGGAVSVIKDVEWKSSFLRDVRDLSHSNFERLTWLGFGLGGITLVPVIASHIVLLWMQPATDTYFRGVLIGANGTSATSFVLIFSAVFMYRYLTLIKTIADRMNALPAKTLS